MAGLSDVQLSTDAPIELTPIGVWLCDKPESMVSAPTKASLTGNGIPMYKTLSQIGISYGLGVIVSL